MPQQIIFMHINITSSISELWCILEATFISAYSFEQDCLLILIFFRSFNRTLSTIGKFQENTYEILQTVFALFSQVPKYCRL
jgi:hypothetical protein